MTAEDSVPLAPDEAFAVLSDEKRVAIVEVLATGTQSDGGLSFAELRKRAGIRDAGQFNYHLSKLRDRFVSKRDDEYYPQYAALRAVGAIRAGTYTERPTTETVTVEYGCPICEDSLAATYEYGWFRLECDEHDTVFQTLIPPRAASDRSVSELVSYANAQAQREIEGAIDGSCTICSGPLSISSPECDENLLLVTLSCEACWMNIEIPVGMAVVRHPAVVSFYYDRGIDLRTEPLLSLDFVRDPESATVISEDPLQTRVTVERGDDSLSLTLGGEFNVVEVQNR